MKKNRLFDYLARAGWKKWVQIMKLTAFLILLFVFDASASFSQNTKISLKVENGTLSEIFSKIEAQSEYRFFYQNEQIRDSGKKNVDVTNKNILDVVNELLKETDLSCKLVDRNIIIFPKSENPMDNIMQQQKSVSGKATDSSGVPLPGVSVVVKGTTTGVITDVDGKYTLAKVPENAVLQFSFVGMKTQELKVSGKTVINITLSEETVGIDEVVAIGYGTTSIRKTVSAISTVQADKIQNIPVSTNGDRLAGRSSGVIVTGDGGGPGKVPTVSIRGGGTPLVVIDGIVSTMDDFQRMNSNDIAAISILKDAEAAAIYGARAGNGIIAVTSKKGESGKMSIKYDYSYSLAQPTVMPKKLGSYERVTLENLASANDGQAPKYAADVVQKYKDQSDPYNYPNTDWQKVCLNSFAPTTRHNLSINGGNEKTKYFASVSAYDQGTLYIFDTNWLKRYNYRFSLTNRFDKIGLTANVNVFGTIEQLRIPKSQYANGYWQTWGHIQNSSPMEIAYTDLGLYSGKGDHPLVEIDPNSGYDKTENRNVNGILDLAWDVPGVKGLKIKAINHYRLNNTWEKSWSATADQYALGSVVPVTHNAPSLYSSAGTGYSYTNQVYGEYNHVFAKDHMLAVTLGYEQTYGYDENIYAQRINYQILFDQFIAGPTLNSSNGGAANENGRAGYIGRLKYDYKSKYFVEGSMRRDGSDWFPSDKRWGNFWSVSGGWVVSEEPFLKSLTDKRIIDYFKLRGSFGTVGLDGSDANISRFQYLSGYSLTERGYLINNQFVQGFSEGPLVSPDLTWYSQKSNNIGFDFTSLNSKLSGSFDYFYMKTTGMLASLSSSTYTDPLGIALPSAKSNGEFRRAGFEFSLSYKNQIGDLRYEIGGNLTRFDQLWAVNPNEDEATLKNPYTRTTQQTGYYGIGYHCLGFYTSAEDVLNSPKRPASTDLVPGDLKYEDINGDGLIDGSDQTRIGKNSFPRVNYGVNIDLKYKAWFLYTLIQGSGNKDLYPGDIIRSGMVYSFQKDYWTPDNTNANFPRLMSSSSYNGNNNAVTSDFWLVNARYIRLKSLQLGYDVKQGLLKGKLPFMSEFSIILNGSNLVTLSEALRRYKIDPEAIDGNNYDYPTERVYSLTVRLGF